MKKFKLIVLSAILALSMVLLAACGGNDNGNNNNGNDNGGDSSYIPDNVTIGAASQGGTYYIYAGGIGTLIDENLGVPTNVEVTGGPVHNMQLIGSKEIDLGLATLGPLYEGYTGTGDWTGGNAIEEARVAFPMYTTPVTWWTPSETGVTSLDGLKDQQVGVGPAGGTSGTYTPMIHEALGLNTNNVQAGAGDMGSQMLDGMLDYIGFAAGAPIAVVTEIEAQRDINIFGIDGEDRDTVLDMFPYFYEYTLPGGTYDSQDEDLETVALYNFGVVHADMDEDFVYDMVKAYHDNNDQMIQTHASAKEAVQEAILINQDVPMHPGAITYYEEAGIDLPDSVYPE